MEYEKFPEPEDIKSQDRKFTMGMNKSRRNWKIGLNRKPTKSVVNSGPKVTFEERKKRGEELKQLRNQVREFKAKKITKRKELRELRKERKKQKELNEIKSGKFEVIKNTKNMKKWSKKIKSQLVKLPAEMFENLLHKRE